MKKTIILTSLISTFFTFSIIALVGFKDSSFTQQTNTSEIGTIVVWPGPESQIPSGWILCDGTDLPKNTYQDLYLKLRTYWNTDEGDNRSFFRVPDLRGVFLRGVNGSRNDDYSDSGLSSRIRLETGSNNGVNDVGSFQADDFASHNHGGGNHNHGGGNHNHGGGNHNHGGGSHNHGGGNHSHTIATYDNNGTIKGRVSNAYTGGNPISYNAETQGSGSIISTESIISYESVIDYETVIDNEAVIDTEGGNETRAKNAYVHFIIYTGIRN